MNYDNNRKSFGYENLKNDIVLNIFDLEFGITIDNEYQKTLLDVAKEMKEEENNIKVLEKAINCLLGNSAYEKIKNKYYKDLSKEIDEFVWIKIINYVMNNIQEYVNNFKNIDINKSQRNKNYNKYERYNRYNKFNKYRRY